MCEWVWRLREDSEYSALSLPIIWFPRGSSLTEPGTRLVVSKSQGPRLSPLTALVLQVCVWPHLSFYMGFWDLNSDLHSCAVHDLTQWVISQPPWLLMHTFLIDHISQSGPVSWDFQLPPSICSSYNWWEGLDKQGQPHDYPIHYNFMSNSWQVLLFCFFLFCQNEAPWKSDHKSWLSKHFSSCIKSLTLY